MARQRRGKTKTGRGSAGTVGVQDAKTTGSTGSTGNGGPSSKGRSSKRNRKKNARPPAGSLAWFINWFWTLVFGAAIYLVIRTFLLATFVITSGSMEGTLLVGDFLLVNRVSLGSPVPGTGLRIPGYSEPKHGDIIVFRADHAPGLDIVKRTVGIPGDTLRMEEGVLYRNGERVDEPYVVRDTGVPDVPDAAMSWQREHLVSGAGAPGYRPTRNNWGPLVIPPERYFMLGDNRENSLDSRFWGLVERDNMRGKPVWIYYSYNRDSRKPMPAFTTMRLGRIGRIPDPEG